ncbi:MAG: biotin/lipoyl-binding protein, partial [Verrucomicrobiales bacterium]|nr:biotin/lipoyl-binding protein [Verrucomicrobiales bacterium]
MLFQASGWIEPDPLPIKATALVNGVVECVGVLEGEVVKQGQILAELISEDFELDLETAESDLT